MAAGEWGATVESDSPDGVDSCDDSDGGGSSSSTSVPSDGEARSRSPSPQARRARGDRRSRGSIGWERSDWGLFQRRTQTVQRDEGEGGGTCRSLTYLCAGREVTFLKPVEGAGTNLMHGDFARKLSPSEEALTTYILKHRRLFDGRRVLVLGAGLGLAGIACAACTGAVCVEMTDGDPEVVGTLAASLRLNEHRFGSTHVSVRQLFWSETGERADDPYDLILAADVVYLEQFHAALLGTSLRSLKPGGHFILIASKRNGSLDKFVTLARTVFPHTNVLDDYDADVTKAIRRSSKCFPIMVRLCSPEAGELPESVLRLCAEGRERNQERQREAEDQQRREERKRTLLRERNATMAECRKIRLEEARRRAEEEAAVAATAAAEAAATAEPAKPRQPVVSHAEQAGRSDWDLFARRCSNSEDEAYKEMVFDCRGQDVIVKKPLGGDFFHGDVARKMSPSEEVLALYIMKHKRQFKKRRILVLGAGLGFAGLVAGVMTAAKHVEITDGDDRIVSLLKENVAANSESFAAKKVTARRLFWGEGLEGVKPFDWIIAADVVYLEDQHIVLLKTLRRLLKPSGMVLIFASPRNGSLDAFTRNAGGVFDRIETSTNYDKDAEAALHRFKCFPRMLRMQWSNQMAGTSVAPRSSIVAGSAKAARDEVSKVKKEASASREVSQPPGNDSRAAAGVGKTSSQRAASERPPLMTKHKAQTQRSCVRSTSQLSSRSSAVSSPAPDSLPPKPTSNESAAEEAASRACSPPREAAAPTPPPVVPLASVRSFLGMAAAETRPFPSMSRVASLKPLLSGKTSLLLSGECGSQLDLASLGGGRALLSSGPGARGRASSLRSPRCGGSEESSAGCGGLELVGRGCADKVFGSAQQRRGPSPGLRDRDRDRDRGLGQQLRRPSSFGPMGGGLPPVLPSMVSAGGRGA